MATNIHTNSNFRNVGMLEIVNEPVENAGSVGAMRSSYYPNAFSVSTSFPYSPLIPIYITSH
jgi:glucan endo-1,6-beta-glucosidase